MTFRCYLAGVLATIALIAAVVLTSADLELTYTPCAVDFSRFVEESTFLAEQIDADEHTQVARLHGTADDPCWPFVTKDCRGPMPGPLTAGP